MVYKSTYAHHFGPPHNGSGASRGNHVLFCKKCLDDNNPCEEAFSYFEKWNPDGYFECRDWTPMHQAVMLADPVMRRWWGWLATRCMIPSHPMRDWDLSGVDLFGANMSGADFSRSWLGKTSLRCVEAYGADFTNCDMDYADLRDVVFKHCDFTGASMENVQAHGACFERCKFYGTTLSTMYHDRCFMFRNDVDASSRITLP